MYALAPDPYVRRILGGRLKQLRKRRGLTQGQLAEQLGLDPSWVSKVEAGRIGPSPGQLRGLCQLLACDPSLLLSL